MPTGTRAGGGAGDTELGAIGEPPQAPDESADWTGASFRQQPDLRARRQPREKARIGQTCAACAERIIDAGDLAWHRHRDLPCCRWTFHPGLQSLVGGDGHLRTTSPRDNSGFHSELEHISAASDARGRLRILFTFRLRDTQAACDASEILM